MLFVTTLIVYMLITDFNLCVFNVSFRFLIFNGFANYKIRFLSLQIDISRIVEVC